jgi:hypothetical protein
VPSHVLELGLAAWTRLRGIISLELLGDFDAMNIDPALHHEAEVERLAQGARLT